MVDHQFVFRPRLDGRPYRLQIPQGLFRREAARLSFRRYFFIPLERFVIFTMAGHLALLHRRPRRISYIRYSRRPVALAIYLQMGGALSQQ